jgi:ribosome-binding factor A
MPSAPRRSGRRGGAAQHRYPRSARVNEILREVLADALERIEDVDERLGLLTITAVQCEPDLRHALVLFSSLTEAEEVALSEARVRLQAAISSQVRLKRTPLLRFAADPAVAEGRKIEDILRQLPETGDAEGSDDEQGGDGGDEQGSDEGGGAGTAPRGMGGVGG